MQSCGGGIDTDEILYVSDTHKQSQDFLRELAEDLDEKGIAFECSRKDFSLETKFYRLICQPMNGACAGRSRHRVKYYADCTMREDMNRRIFLKADAKKIESRKQIIELLSGEVS